MTEDRIFVLTGPVHAGKTTFLRHLMQGFRDEGIRVNGILSLAVFKDSIRVSYDAFDLANGDSCPLLRTDPDPSWDRAGPFGMIPAGLRRAESAITDTSHSSLTVIDELGPLELAGQGFWPGFQVVREKRLPILLVVRQELIDRFQKTVKARAHLFHFGEAGLGADMRSRRST